jgi:hypothetical protein
MSKRACLRRYRTDPLTASVERLPCREGGVRSPDGTTLPASALNAHRLLAEELEAPDRSSGASRIEESEIEQCSFG